MCGIFGAITSNGVDKNTFKSLAILSRRRGKDSSGYAFFNEEKKQYCIKKYPLDIKLTLNAIYKHLSSSLIIGHSRLVTKSTKDNQPIIRKKLIVIHNGLITNYDEIIKKYNLQTKLNIDTELIPLLLNRFIEKGKTNYYEATKKIFEICKGIISASILIPEEGKMLLISNNGSLFTGKNKQNLFFSSEKFFLEKINCTGIEKVVGCKIFDIPLSVSNFNLEEKKIDRHDLAPKFTKNKTEKELLLYKKSNILRCSKCVLPETMPFIYFNDSGVCNYCINYKKSNIPELSFEELENFFSKYKKKYNNEDCIVPLSGGRDSCYTLHSVVKHFKLKPLTYTYDWGLVTDLARRNISRMCSELNVQNIIFADDISKKRQYIKKNIIAWLKKPDLGMVNIFTAGDKHFFRHINKLKKDTSINLDIWGINPLETTHFKAGFLGIKPNFENKSVYRKGVLNQIEYQSLRFKKFFNNLSYFNSSILDNLYGEFYRSIMKKSDHFSLFNYIKWQEDKVEKVLLSYNWEGAVDTKSTWRVGDGAAAFYNYIYFTLAGFSEHETFRSNQIREGDITRAEALKICEIENIPRYENIKWFLDIVNLDFSNVIKRINDFKLNQ